MVILFNCCYSSDLLFEGINLRSHHGLYEVPHLDEEFFVFFLFLEALRSQ